MKMTFGEKTGARMPTYILLLAGAVAAMFSLRHCSTPPPGKEKEISASGGDTLDVAISYSPMTLYRYADTLGGFSYDLLRELSASDGFIFKYHPVTSAESALDGLKSGLYDLVVCDMARTTDMEDVYSFTTDIYLDRQVLVQKTLSNGSVAVSTPLELGGKKVWVEASSPAFWRLKHLSEEIGDTIYVEADTRYTSEQLALMVDIGDIPFAVINEHVAKLLERDSALNINTAVSFTQFQSWVVRKQDGELLDRVNAAVDSLKAKPVYEELFLRYRLRGGSD